MKSEKKKKQHDAPCTGLDTNEREPEVIDAATGKPDPSQEADKLLGRGYLSTGRDCRIALAKIIRAEVAGTLEHNRARGLVWMVRELGKQIYETELEQRIRELEALTLSADGRALSGQRALSDRTLN